jgi:hypothetical protein
LPTISIHLSEIALKGELKTAIGGFAKTVVLNLNVSLLLLVNEELHWGLANEIYERLKALPKEEYGRIAREVGLVGQLNAAVAQKPLTSYQLGAAALLYQADSAVAKAELPDHVIAKVALFGVSYGGELPIKSRGESHLHGE